MLYLNSRCAHVLMVMEFTDFIATYSLTASSRKLLRAGKSGVRFPAESRYCSPLQNVQFSSENHPTSYPVGTRGFAQNVKRQYCKADHLTPTILEFEKKKRKYISCLHSEERANFTF